MEVPQEQDLKFLKAISRSDLGPSRDAIDLNPNSLITCKSFENKLKYYENPKILNDLKSKILKYSRYQYGLQIFTGIHEDMKRYESLIFSKTQEFNEIVSKRKTQVHNDHAVYCDYIEISENGLRKLNEDDQQVTYKKFLENMANNILLTLFNKSIRIWTLRLTENYERYRVEQRVGYEMYIEGGRKIIEMLNYQIFWINHSIHIQLSNKFQENCNILNEFGMIINDFQQFSNLDIPEEVMNEHRLVENFLGIMRFFDRFASHWIELTEKLEEFKFQQIAIPREIEIWKLKNLFDQEVAAGPYLAAAVKYLSKKLRKVEHRLAVYETVSRLDKIDQCINEANACISAVTAAINSMTMSGDVHISFGSSTYSNSYTSFTYTTSRVWDDFDLHKSNVIADISDASHFPIHSKTMDNELEKSQILAELNSAVQRTQQILIITENYRAGAIKAQNDIQERDKNINDTKELIQRLKSTYEIFVEEHQSALLELKKHLILPWYCMFLSHLNVTNPRKFGKLDKNYDFLATRLHPKFIVEILYEILLQKQKIREKKFRLFGKDETKKVFNCGIITLDILIELYTHPRIFGCFKDDETGEGQKIENCLRSENCKSSFFKCIRDTVNIIIFGDLIHSDINKLVNEERIRSYQKYGLGLLKENGYDRIRDKIKGYKMKLTKRAKTMI
jgi:hypothetical protein